MKTKTKQEERIKLYLQDLLYFSNIPNQYEEILYELLKRAIHTEDNEEMEICLNASLKKRIANKLGIKAIGSVYKAISDLVNGKVLFPIERGIYQFNPDLFGKNDWKDISNLHIEVKYNETQGRKVLISHN